MKDKRYVIDTNVLISGELFPESLPGKAIDKAVDTGLILLSQNVFAEILDVLYRPKLDKYLSDSRRFQFLFRLTQISEYVESISEKITACKDDPKDNKFLELAVSGKAHCLVSGDSRHLLKMHPFRGIPIWTPRQFLEQG